jgi:hypothetical protein
MRYGFQENSALIYGHPAQIRYDNPDVNSPSNTIESYV